MNEPIQDPNQGRVQIVHTLSVPTDGGPQTMLCANTEGLFGIIQSIPSPNLQARPQFTPLKSDRGSGMLWL
jgi:hypothetical protein